MSIVIDSINGMLWGRARTDVFDERIEISSPSGANPFARSAVADVGGHVWIEAAVFHGLPDPVFGAFCGDRMVTEPDTATALCMAVLKLCSINNDLLAAFAFAIPVSVLVFESGKGYDSETSKLSIGQIDKLCASRQARFQWLFHLGSLSV